MYIKNKLDFNRTKFIAYIKILFVHLYDWKNVCP